MSAILDISPAEQPDMEEEKPVARSRHGRMLSNSVVRRVALAIAAFLVLPYFLVLLYAIPFVRPVSTLMIADLAMLRGYDRQWTYFEDISPALVRSVMMSEDGQFCAHGGVDWNQMRGVVQDALDGSSTRGASTIPMQTVKNLFLWNGRSFLRKGLEMPLAMWADFIWSKERMMEIYLNVAEMGPQTYGAGAAARLHFKTPPSKLSRRQAALLAASLPNPLTRVASKPSRGMQRIASVVERRAQSAGDYITCLYR